MAARWHRLWRHITGISIRYKLLGMVLAVVVLLGLAVTVPVQAQLAEDLRQGLEERGSDQRSAEGVKELLSGWIRTEV